jgi:dUTP pyrophosphatase
MHTIFSFNSSHPQSTSLMSLSGSYVVPSILKIKLLEDSAKMPTRAHSTDLGYDLYALETMYIPFGKPVKIRTGIAVEFPKGYGAFIKDRSSMASKGLATIGGVIDETYTGEISVIMLNLNFSFFKKKIIHKGDKIAQLVPIQTVNWDIEVVEELSVGERGNKGFGSSGK